MTLAELREGRMRSCRVAERDIVVCHTPSGVHALENICTHALARMSEGRLKGERLICPLHGASFDVSDGRVLAGPATFPLTLHSVRVVDGAIEIAVDPALPA
jgi:nitrite reductase/ring-hydroxylating ferredoxin subunit